MNDDHSLTQRRGAHIPLGEMHTGPHPCTEANSNRSWSGRGRGATRGSLAQTRSPEMASWEGFPRLDFRILEVCHRKSL